VPRRYAKRFSFELSSYIGRAWRANNPSTRTEPIINEYPTRNIEYSMRIGSRSQASMEIGYWIFDIHMTIV